MLVVSASDARPIGDGVEQLRQPKTYILRNDADADRRELKG